MENLEDIIFESGDHQSMIMEYVADICLEINSIKSNYTDLNTDYLVSKLKLLIKHFDSLLMESEDNKNKLDSSLRETAVLESKLDLEKKQRQLDLDHSFHFQEIERGEKEILSRRLKETEEKLRCNTDKFNSLLEENQNLVQSVTKLKTLKDLL